MRWLSLRRPSVFLLVCALALLTMTATAFAVTRTGPATWSAYSPADAGTVGVVRPTIAAVANDPKGLAGSPYYSLKLDGKAQSAVFTRVDATTVKLAFVPRADLANGTHTVYMSVKNNAGVYSTTTWTFTVSNAPKPSAPVPVPGSTIKTTAPTISVAVDGATTGLTSTVVVDGKTVPSSFDAATGLVTAPLTGLANDAGHDTTVTVTNADGQSDFLAWSFSVQIYEAMPVPAEDCVTCHPGFPDAHPMDNCLACHGPGSPTGEGWNTPDYGPHSASYIAATPTSCVDCHSSGYATVPAMHGFTPVATYHDSTTSCSPCHVKSLTTEHNRYGATCLSCHASPDPLVQTAMATGRTDCEACHPGAAGHAELHATEVPATCAGPGCHAGAGLTDVHDPSKVSCDTCHKSADPRVVAAIAGKVKTCDACHSSVDHETQHAVTVETGCAGSGCHAASSLTSLHINSSTTMTCASCHDSTEPKVAAAIKARDKSCTACHDGAAPHGDIAPQHTVATPSCTVDGCHPGGSDVSAIHAAKQNCATCHGAGKTPTSNCTASGCHANMNGHGDVSALHKPAVTSQAITFLDSTSVHQAVESPGAAEVVAECAMCHATADLGPLHANDCATCHFGSASPRDSFATWQKGCSQGACHPTYHAGASAGHDSYYKPAARPQGCYCHDELGLAESAGALQADAAFCGGCHKIGADTTPPVSGSDALATYVGPAVITITAADDRGVYRSYYKVDGGPTTVVSGVVYVDAPASGSQAHSIEFWSKDLSGNVETSHKTAVFTITPDTEPPVTTSDAVATYNGPAVITFTVTDNATSRGPKTTYYQFDGGAVQAGTTAVLPQPVGGMETHSVRYWSEDWSGNVEAAKTATFDVTADVVAPTSTSSLQAKPVYYPGSTFTIDFYPTDPAPSSGIAGVRLESTNPNVWWPDGHEASYNATTGTWQLAIAGNVTGDYPMTWRARDKAGNVETAKTTVITVDAERPVTSVSVESAHTYMGDITVALTGVDTGGSGYANSWYRLDGAAYQAGTSVLVTAPATGTRLHSLYYYSTDAAGNQETPRHITFSVMAPYIYTLNYTAGTGGTISGANPQFVAWNQSGTPVTAVADTGYTFVDWSDGVTSATRTDANVTANATVTANFLINTYTVTYAASPGGTISGTKVQTIPYNGSSATVTAVGSTGYHFLRWSDGSTSATRTDANIVADARYTATFERNSYTLSYTAGPGGTISGTSPQTVLYQGSGTAVTAVPDSGYTFVSWSDGSTQNPRTDTNVAASRNLTATFAVAVPTLPATLHFHWNPPLRGQATLHVQNAAGVTIASTTLDGTGAALNWDVSVPSGANYYMVCDWYYDHDGDVEGGGYGQWTGVLPSGGSYTWLYVY